MEKWMIVYVLPLEVWMEIFVFPWITRQEFGKIVDKIGNFKFAEIAQFFLHEWGKRKLKGVDLFKNGGLPNLPETRLPPNIKSFDSILISHFDAKTLHFLKKIRPLLTDLEIQIIDSFGQSANAHTVFYHMAPFLDGIHSLKCAEQSLFAAEQLLPHKFNKIKVLTIDKDSPAKEEPHDLNIDIIMDWLTQNGPKFCRIGKSVLNYFSEKLETAVRQQFLAAKNPSVFVVHFYFDQQEIEEFRLVNGIGDKLIGSWHEDGRVFQITCNRKTHNVKDLQEWVKENTKEGMRGQIRICNPTIGQISPRIEAQAEQQPYSPIIEIDYLHLMNEPFWTLILHTFLTFCFGVPAVDEEQANQ